MTTLTPAAAAAPATHNWWSSFVSTIEGFFAKPAVSEAVTGLTTVADVAEDAAGAGALNTITNAASGAFLAATHAATIAAAASGQPVTPASILSNVVLTQQFATQLQAVVTLAAPKIGVQVGKVATGLGTAAAVIGSVAGSAVAAPAPVAS